MAALHPGKDHQLPLDGGYCHRPDRSGGYVVYLVGASGGEFGPLDGTGSGELPGIAQAAHRG
jgi:hypothetical protein